MEEAGFVWSVSSDAVVEDVTSDGASPSPDTRRTGAGSRCTTLYTERWGGGVCRSLSGRAAACSSAGVSCCVCSEYRWTYASSTWRSSCCCSSSLFCVFAAEAGKDACKLASCARGHAASEVGNVVGGEVETASGR